ncbi:DNA-binding transcriptional regulator, LysR family [Rhodoferax sp. OV413]|uniref:LysR substrate-binding domain-containing protein n=1 Tax=Rhodoferax sp. OV413 TaxID=1855285 RepID=UPI0008810DBB|nr:LysR substrate-binding domain-containing protein [Rhodoferax sp. OV413]SDO38685.1 DNA-binding transcriptional regulator, LysR family [Rhodoferax sp. OV413]
MDTPEVPDPFWGVAVFVAAARADNFTQAADRIGLTKSSVGKTIARLEQSLGIKLFHRTTRLTRLTADGEAYLAACTSALDEITAAQAALSSSNRVLSGRIHIDMPVAFGRRVLLPALVEITRPHPGLSLSLTFTDATSDLLQDDVDIAIRFGALKDSDHLVARHLATQDRVICAAPGYLRAMGEPTTLADIRQHRCIVGSLKGPPLVWVVQEDGVERRLTPPPTHQLTDGEAMVDAAVSGLGLGQFALSLVRQHLESGRLQAVLPTYSSVGVDIHAVWPKRAQLSPRVRYVVDELVAYAGKGRFN